MTNWPILSLITFLPLVGAFFCLIVNGPKEAVERNCRSIAIVTTLLTFVISLVLWAKFDPTKAGFQFEEKLAWVPALNIGYHVGIDGISLFFVLLSTLLTVLCILASWESIHERVKEYMVAFLILETLMVGMFAALDIVLFYVFFEGVLIPMFLIIGVWGGERRVYRYHRAFLYYNCRTDYTLLRDGVPVASDSTCVLPSSRPPTVNHRRTAAASTPRSGRKRPATASRSFKRNFTTAPKRRRPPRRTRSRRSRSPRPPASRHVPAPAGPRRPSRPTPRPRRPRSCSAPTRTCRARSSRGACRSPTA